MFDWLRILIGRETAAQRRARERAEAEKRRDEVRMEAYRKSIGAKGISPRTGDTYYVPRTGAAEKTPVKRDITRSTTSDAPARHNDDGGMTNLAVGIAIASAMDHSPSRSCSTPSYSSSSFDSGGSSSGDGGGGGGGGCD